MRHTFRYKPRLRFRTCNMIAHKRQCQIQLFFHSRWKKLKQQKQQNRTLLFMISSSNSKYSHTI